MVLRQPLPRLPRPRRLRACHACAWVFNRPRAALGSSHHALQRRCARTTAPAISSISFLATFSTVPSSYPLCAYPQYSSLFVPSLCPYCALTSTLDVFFFTLLTYYPQYSPLRLAPFSSLSFLRSYYPQYSPLFVPSLCPHEHLNTTTLSQAPLGAAPLGS